MIPKLPDSSTLKPFPTALNISYIGHKAGIKAIASSPQGIYMASGDESGVIMIWETQSSKCLWQKTFKECVHSITWSCSNVIAFSHGDTAELMIWKYPKGLRDQGEELVNMS